MWDFARFTERLPGAEIHGSSAWEVVPELDASSAPQIVLFNFVGDSS
jgi:hypothetical protein